MFLATLLGRCVKYRKSLDREFLCAAASASLRRSGLRVSGRSICTPIRAADALVRRWRQHVQRLVTTAPQIISSRELAMRPGKGTQVLRCS